MLPQKWSSHQWYSRLNAPLFSGLKQHLAELQKAKQFDIVMTSYLFTSSVLDSFDRSVLKVIDAHDDLIDREVHLLRHGIESDWGSLSEVQARMAMEKCDLLLGISERETSRHEQIVSGKSFCLGHVNTDDYQEKPFQVETPEILFVASDNPINQQSWSWFIKQVYPLLEVKIDFKINVLGSICLFKEQFKQRKKIKYIGPVENLKAHYRRSSMVINPCLGGTGVKIKSLEALAHGLPLVTTQYGASGLENLAQKCLLTASSAQEFAESTNSLLLNPALRSELGIRGRSFFSRYNQIQKSRLKDLLFLEKSSETFSEKVGCLIGKNYWSEPIVCAPENSASNSV